MRVCPECEREFDDSATECPDDGEPLSEVIEAPVDPLIGTTVGSYRVARKLGQGGMGAVYESVHPVIGTRVAVKFLNPEVAHKKAVVDRFFNEARAATIIGHDNVLKILDLGQADGRYYVIMEYLEGYDLKALMAGRPLDLAVAGPILLQICDALEAAHDKGIIHRDLKPSNIFLIVHSHRKHFVKVVDFGIAKLARGSALKTRTGVVLGTPAYMSPEQARGRLVDNRTDIYSLGIIAYQMATGRLPFRGKTATDVLVAQVKDPPPPMRPPDTIPPGLERLVLKALGKDPEERPPSMRAFADELAAVMRAEGASFELPPATPEEEQRHKSIYVPVPAGPVGIAAAKTSPDQPTERRAGRPLSWAIAALAVAAIGAAATAAVLLAGRDRDARAAATAADATAGAGAPSPAPPPSSVAPMPAPAASAAPEPVAISVVSDPSKAQIRAEWESATRFVGPAPAQFLAPRGASVKLSLSLEGHAEAHEVIVADSPRLVSVKLERAPPPPEKAGAPRAPAAPRSAAAPKAKEAAPKPATQDAPVEVEF